ncbi:MAG: hypothetical protein M3Y44_10925 [Actinomycetota bacterium]|nr:hypothetical protein [Actinomycetota bacterium]
MRIRRARLAVGAAVLATAMAAALATPSAAQAAPTTVTFTLTSGALTITAPVAAALGTGAAGGTLTAALGSVAVSDLRGSLVAAWTATASTSTFTTGGATAAETVPTAAVSYWSGPSTSTSGLGVFTPGQLTALNAVTLSAPATAFALAAGVGNNAASWNPTLIIAVPAAAVAGSYSGTVTHSVA